MIHEASGVGSRFIDRLFLGGSRAVDDMGSIDRARIYDVGQGMCGVLALDYEVHNTCSSLVSFNNSQVEGGCGGQEAIQQLVPWGGR